MLASMCARRGMQGREINLGMSNNATKGPGDVLMHLINRRSLSYYPVFDQHWSRCKLVLRSAFRVSTQGRSSTHGFSKCPIKR